MSQRIRNFVFLVSLRKSSTGRCDCRINVNNSVTSDEGPNGRHRNVRQTRRISSKVRNFGRRNGRESNRRHADRVGRPTNAERDVSMSTSRRTNFKQKSSINDVTTYLRFFDPVHHAQVVVNFMVQFVFL